MIRYALFISIFLLTTGGIQAQHSVEFHAGVVANLPTNLTISQAGFPDLNIDAEYDSRALDDPIYYVIRFGFAAFQQKWQLQFTHQKLYLKNKPPEIEQFEISHGFNIFTLNYVFEFRKFHAITGVGFVLAHPQSEIRGEKFAGSGGILESGYRLTGPVFLIGIGKTFPIKDSVYLAVNGLFSAGRANVPVANGTAHTTNYALQATLGAGYGF